MPCTNHPCAWLLKDTKELTVFSNISKKHFNILTPAKAKSLNVLSDNRRQARHTWGINPGKKSSTHLFSYLHLKMMNMDSAYIIHTQPPEKSRKCSPTCTLVTSHLSNPPVPSTTQRATATLLWNYPGATDVHTIIPNADPIVVTKPNFTSFIT